MSREEELAKLMKDWHDAIGKENYFNPDGIVDPASWDEQDAGKKVLFVLKETNELKGDSEKDPKSVSLVEHLMKPSAPSKYGSMWPRIAEWWHAIYYNNDAYHWYETQEAQKILKNVAVMNLKKTPGSAQAKEDDVVQHIKDHWERIQQEIDLIDPDIIVFCGTWWMIQQAHQEYKNAISELRFAKMTFPPNSGKTRLLIEYWHPAARYPTIVMYYGIQGIYRVSRAEN